MLFGLSLCLLVGAAAQQFLKRVPLPYTVLLLVFGTLLGAWTMFDPAFTLQPGMRAGDYAWGDAVLACNVTTFVPNDLHHHGYHLGNALRQLSSIDSHLLLHLLLPPLLFESAFAIDWHVFTKIWGYALLLAVPGLIIATILTGLTYIGFYPEWPWEAAMLLGGILAATDPGATPLARAIPPERAPPLFLGGGPCPPKAARRTSFVLNGGARKWEGVHPAPPPGNSRCSLRRRPLSA